MQPGPKPLPTHLKLMRGTLRKDRLNRKEPKVAPAVPSCPRHLGKEAKHEWRRVSKELRAMGLLTKVDRAALAMYCDAWGRWVDALEALRRYGVMVKSPSGFPMQSPYLAVANKAMEQMRLLLGEFGMSPSARTRIHAQPVPEEEESKWAGLL